MRRYLSPISRIAFLTAAFVCVNPARLGAADAHTADQPATGEPAFTITVAPGKTAAQVHNAVIAAATKHGWTIQENAADKLVLYHRRHGHEATVTLVPSASTVAAYWEGYAITSKGVRKHPEQPTDWLRYLRQDISGSVGDVRPAK